MPRYSAGGKTSAGSATLPLISLYGHASVSAKVREIGIFNTTSTAFDVKLVRLTTAGTKTDLTEGKYDPASASASCTAHNTHTVGPSLGDDMGYRASLGAAVGAGVIWTFGDQGIRITNSTSDGLGVVAADGSTSQPIQAYIVWDE